MKNKKEIIGRLKELDKKLDALLENGKGVLTLPEAADYLGLSKSYLYKLTSKKILPHSKPLGKKLFFKRERANRKFIASILIM